MNENNEISVLVTGNNIEGRALITNVINDALEDAGFMEVSLVNSIGDPVDREDTASMLDVMQARRPELFATPIMISSRPAPGSIEEDTIGPTDEIGGEEDQSNLPDLTDMPVPESEIPVY